MNTKQILAFASIILSLTPQMVLAEGNPKKFKSPMELINLEVTSVSKIPEDPFKAPAAVHVITRKDIERSGATTIAEALRLAPGLQVAQSSSNQWAISARGFNGGFANKLLVMIDGRTVYTPLFSGVYWGVQDTLLQDIKQIEVIRGPGATQWGANAVNGVINIITEEAANTEYSFISGTIGNQDKGSVEGRFGKAIDENTSYRVYAKHFNRNDLRTLSDTPGNDEWNDYRSGFKLDHSNTNDSFTLQGDIYRGDQDLDLFLPALPTKTNQRETLIASGGNILGKWEHDFDDGGQSVAQLFYDRTRFDYSQLDQVINTIDLDLQYSKRLNDRHEIVSGLGYRYIFDDMEGSNNITLTPSQRNFDLASAFIQDKITVVPEKVFFTLGTKFEHNDFTGFEIQPSARVAWLPTEDQTVWAAISRAVRTPSRAEHDIKLTLDTSGGVAFVRQEGDTGFEAEELIAYEIGYKVRPTTKTALDFAAFYNDYSDLRSVEFAPVVVEGASVFAPVFPKNLGEGEAYGVEVSGDWEVTKKWNLKANYTYLNISLRTKQGSTDITLENDENRSPRHQFGVHSQLDLPYNISLDNSLYYVDDIIVTDLDSQNVEVPSYFRFDTRIGWKYNDNLSFDLVGQNLLDDLHPEFSGALFSKDEQVPRTIYGRITYLF